MTGFVIIRGGLNGDMDTGSLWEIERAVKGLRVFGSFLRKVISLLALLSFFAGLLFWYLQDILIDENSLPRD